MPYSLYKSGSKFCVKNSDTGESKGCSSSRSQAVSHMRALYAAEGGEKMGKKKQKEIDDLVLKEVDTFNTEYPPTEDEVKELEELHTKHYEDSYIDYTPWGVVTFAELDAWREAQEDAHEIRRDSDAFISIVGNIMSNSDIKDKSKAIKSLADEFSTRMNEGLGDDKEIRPKGLRARFDDAVLKFKQALFKEEDKQDQHPENLMVWLDKESNQWRWIARYSNNFRDRDNPPEIISQDSHRRFVDRVEKGLAPYPELWLWHVPEWKIGQSTWVAYDDSGFAMAAGYFNDGSEQVAEWLSKQSDFLVSHGMPPHTIERDSSDKSVIINHDTREISPLPGIFAANELTGFYVEADMAIPDAKKKALVDQWGMSAETLAQLEVINAKTAEEAENKGLERKEETPVEEVKTEEPVAPPVEEVKEETPLLDQPPTRQEIADAVAAILVPLVDEVKALRGEMNVMKETLAAKEKTSEDAVVEKIKETPLASLAALMTQRVIGNSDTQIDGRSELAKSHPKETSAQKTPTGIPFLDNMLTAEKS